MAGLLVKIKTESTLKSIGGRGGATKVAKTGAPP